jgi:hypothetical protein
VRQGAAAVLPPWDNIHVTDWMRACSYEEMRIKFFFPHCLALWCIR